MGVFEETPGSSEKSGARTFGFISNGDNGAIFQKTLGYPVEKEDT